jgi:hypothetical protein
LHCILSCEQFQMWGDHRGHDRMVVEFTIIYAISTYHHWWCEFESRSGRGPRYTTLCDKVCQWLATGRWFSPGPPISFTNKTDRHDITKILLKVALNTIKQTNKQNIRCEAFAWFAYIVLRPWPNTNKAYKLIESLKGCW